MVDIQQMQQGGTELRDPFAVLTGGIRRRSISFSMKDQFGQNLSKSPGTFYEGVVIERPETMQETEYNEDGTPGDPKFWQDGRPVEMVRVILQTELDEGPDENGEPDDGVRALYVRGQMKKAFGDAMKAAGVKSFDIGTRVKVTLLRLEPTKGFPRKVYGVELTPGATNPDVNAQFAAAAAADQSNPYLPQQGAQAPAQPQAGAAVVQQVLDATEIPQQQAQPQQPVAQAPVQQQVAPVQQQGLVVTQQHVAEVTQLIAVNIPREQAIQAVALKHAQGDAAFATALDAAVPF